MHSDFQGFSGSYPLGAVDSAERELPLASTQKNGAFKGAFSLMKIAMLNRTSQSRIYGL
ncbi:hypothetical protein AB3X91_12560 [Paraburkholderia sp. BR14263]|uniref:hypothetical protein n=1 Tax=unclassified Paraburkholderia TaxID=2615204 RepID=UPI0034CFD812